MGSITDCIAKPVLRGFAFGLVIVKQLATPSLPILSRADTGCGWVN